MDQELYDLASKCGATPSEMEKVKKAGKDTYTYAQLRKSGLSHREAFKRTGRR